MEDSHSVHLSLPPTAGTPAASAEDAKVDESTEGEGAIPKQPEGSTVTNDEKEGVEEGNAFFGVFDGHGGKQSTQCISASTPTAAASLPRAMWLHSRGCCLTCTRSRPTSLTKFSSGSGVAKFTGTTIHKRLAALESYSASHGLFESTADEKLQKRVITRQL